MRRMDGFATEGNEKREGGKGKREDSHSQPAKIEGFETRGARDV